MGLRPAHQNESRRAPTSRDGYGAGASLEYPLADARGSYRTMTFDRAVLPWNTRSLTLAARTEA